MWLIFLILFFYFNRCTPNILSVRCNFTLISHSRRIIPSKFLQKCCTTGHSTKQCEHTCFINSIGTVWTYVLFLYFHLRQGCLYWINTTQNLPLKHLSCNLLYICISATMHFSVLKLHFLFQNPIVHGSAVLISTSFFHNVCSGAYFLVVKQRNFC